MVGVDRHVRIGQIDLQPEASFARVGQCFRHRIAGQQALRFELSIDPGKELFDAWLGVRQSVVEFLRGAKFLFADALFHGVEAADQFQSLRRDLRFDVFRFEQLAPGVCPALGVSEPRLLRISANLQRQLSGRTVALVVAAARPVGRRHEANEKECVSVKARAIWPA